MFLAGTLASCQPAAERPGPVSQQDQGLRRDSAGITIVEHTLRSLDQSAVLRETPDLRIDSIPRTNRPEFHRLSGVAFLDSGRLVLGHEGGKELLLFEANGQLVQSVGRDGSGPGEFRSIEGPWSLEGNRFAASDGVIRRVTTFGAPDAILRSTSIVNRMLPDSSFFIWRTFGITRNGTTILWVIGPPPSTVGMARPYMSIVAVDSTGRAWNVGPQRPGLEQYVMAPQREGSFSVGVSPFAAAPLVAACGNNVVVADNQSYTVSVLSLDGRTSTIVTAPVVQRPAADDDYLAVLRDRLGAEAALDESHIAPMRAMTPRGLLPVLRAIHCDASGAFWVEEHPDPVRDVRRVVVYTSSGNRRFSLELPPGTRMLGVHDVKVALAVKDDDGLEHFELRSVETSGA